MEDSAEDFVWLSINPDNIWVMDKLILARKLKYNSGPVGLDVPHPGFYIVRCLLYTSPSPRDRQKSRMPSSA